MKVGHFQSQVIPECFKDNLQTVLRGLKQARTEKLEIVSFPESLLTGYFTDEQKARDNSFEINGPEIKQLLDETKGFDSTFIVGFNELRKGKIFNSTLIAYKGQLQGIYSKAFPCIDYFAPGRDFPIFQCGDITFGVIICADGGYIEPARILALKGAQIIFAPHYNYIAPENVVDHYHTSRNDHIGRAIEMASGLCAVTILCPAMIKDWATQALVVATAISWTPAVEYCAAATEEPNV